MTAALAFVAATVLPDWLPWFDVIYLIILGMVVGIVMFAVMKKQGKPLPVEAFAEAMDEQTDVTTPDTAETSLTAETAQEAEQPVDDGSAKEDK